MLDENKTVKTVGIVAVLGIIAAIVGILADSATFIDWLTGKKKTEPETDSVTIIETQQQSFLEVDETFSPIEIEPEQVTTEQSEIYLKNLKIVESDDFGNTDSAKDTLGNQYLGNVCKIGSKYVSDAYVTYYLGGQYKVLSGTIAVDDDTSKYTNDGQLFISSDNTIIYSTDEMDRTSVPVEFSIDVENCQWLKISRVGGSGWFILYNWKLE